MALMRAAGRISLAIRQEQALREGFSRLGLFFNKCRSKGGLLKLFFTDVTHQQVVLLVRPADVHRY